jgi:hypothetical protein
MADTTRYDIEFVAPQLPLPPVQYDANAFNQFNNILSLYFNQLDNAPQAETAGWFFS